MRIGLIGLGRMGRPIAHRLLDAALPMQLFDADPAALDGFAVEHRAQSLAVLARACDVVLTCVPGPAAVEAVLAGPGGLFASLKQNSIVVEMSAISFVDGRRFAALALARGLAFLDAPLSGGIDGAAAGTLTAMVGGDPTVLVDVTPILRTFCARVVHLGAAGSGYLAKSINQMIYLTYAAAFSEAVALGERGGLTRADLVDVLRTSIAGQPLATRWEQRLLDDDDTPGFAIGRVIEDLEAGEAACEALAFKSDLLDAALETYRALAQSGLSASDMTAVFRRRLNAAVAP